MKKKSSLSRLFEYAGNYKYLTVLSWILSAVSAWIALVPFYYIWRIIKEVLAVAPDYSQAQNLKGYGWAAVGFALLSMIIYVGSLMCSHVAAFHVQAEMRSQMMHHIVTLPMGFMDSEGSGKIRKIVNESSAATETYLAHQLPDQTGAYATPVGLLVLLLVFDWRLGLLSLVPVVAAFLIMGSMTGEKMQQKMKEYQNALEEMSSEAVEYVRGIPVVKTFGQSVESFKRLYTSIIVMKDSVLKMTMGYRNKMSMFEATSGSTAFFLVPAALFIIAAGENPHEVVADSIIYFLIGPIFGVLIMRTATISQYLYFAELALDKIEDILEYDEMAYGKEDQTTGGIEFKNVSFSYGSEKVLDNISFKVNRGETVALVGRSGSGKTTIARLAARFYDADEGEVLLGGSNIKEYDKTSLMRKISFVFQNARLFKMSLRENLLCGKEDAIDKEIEQALFDAGAKEIVDGLKDGLETVYGTKGTYFSGGEAQRLVIARAFLKDAEYVILDEATAFADPENERIIQESFKKLAENKTTLLIAHRLSTVVNADKILVIEKGRIAEEGKHEALLEKNGIYKSLWDEYRRSVNWKIGGKND